jgi:hypothetical protein
VQIAIILGHKRGEDLLGQSHRERVEFGQMDYGRNNLKWQVADFGL